MTTLRMDPAAVLALVERVLNGADQIDQIIWPTMASTSPAAMSGAAVEFAGVSSAAQDRLAGVVAHMRTWAATVRASTAEIQRADARQAGRLGAPR